MGLYVLLLAVAVILSGALAIQSSVCISVMRRRLGAIASAMRSLQANRAATSESNDSLLERALRIVRQAPRCPRCSALVPERAQFCGACGESFARPAVTAARITYYRCDRRTPAAVELRWECRCCGDATTELLDHRDCAATQILPLKCDECGSVCGEVLLDPSTLEQMPLVHAAGSLRLPIGGGGETAARGLSDLGRYDQPHVDAPATEIAQRDAAAAG